MCFPGSLRYVTVPVKFTTMRRGKRRANTTNGKERLKTVKGKPSNGSSGKSLYWTISWICILKLKCRTGWMWRRVFVRLSILIHHDDNCQKSAVVLLEKKKARLEKKGIECCGWRLS